MKERKFKRILKKKPYIMDVLFRRSRFGAQQMALASRLTIEQVLHSIKQGSDVSSAVWARVDLALKAKGRKDNYRSTIKEWFDKLSRGVIAHR